MSVLGWVVFIGLAVAFFLLLNRQGPPAARGPRPMPARVYVPPTTAPTIPRRTPLPPVALPASLSLVRVLIPLVPWLLIFGLIWFFIFRQMRATQKTPQSSLFAPGSGRPDPAQQPAAGNANLRSAKTWLTAGALAIGGVFIIVVQGVIAEEEAPPMLLHPVVRTVPWFMLVSALLILVRTGGVGIRRLWDGQPHLQRPKRIEVTDEGVTTSDAVSRSEYRWPSFTHVRETPNLFLLYMSHFSFQMVPKRAFASAAEANEFRELARRMVVERPGPAFPVLPALAIPHEDPARLS